MSLPKNPRAKCWGWFKIIPGNSNDVECAYASCKKHIPYVEGNTTGTRKMNEHIEKVHCLRADVDTPPISSSQSQLKWGEKQSTFSEMEKMEKIAHFFAVNSILRSVFASLTYQSAHVECIPAGMHHTRNIDAAIESLYKNSVRNLQIN